MGGLSLWHWLVVLLVVVLVFGTKRLRNMGQDVGEAVKGFKKGVADPEASTDVPPAQLPDAARSNEVTPERDDQQTPR